jgi:hypothetical protein
MLLASVRAGFLIYNGENWPDLMLAGIVVSVANIGY